MEKGKEWQPQEHDRRILGRWLPSEQCAVSLARVGPVERLIHLLVIASKGTRHSSSSDGRVWQSTMHQRASAAGEGQVVREKPRRETLGGETSYK